MKSRNAVVRSGVSAERRHISSALRCSLFRRISTCRAVAQRRRICVHLPRRSPTKADLRSTAVSFSRSPRISRLNFSESEFFVFFALFAVPNSPLRRICRHFSLILSAFPPALCGFKFPLLNSQTPSILRPKIPSFSTLFSLFFNYISLSIKHFQLNTYRKFFRFSALC